MSYRGNHRMMHIFEKITKKWTAEQRAKAWTHFQHVLEALVAKYDEKEILKALVNQGFERAAYPYLLKPAQEEVTRRRGSTAPRKDMRPIVEAVIDARSRQGVWKNTTPETARGDANRTMESLLAEYGVEAAVQALDGCGFKDTDYHYLLEPLYKEAAKRRDDYNKSGEA